MKEDLATLGFVFSTLSVSTWYRPIDDCCICSYEAHLNIKEEFILGFSPERVFVGQSESCMVYLSLVLSLMSTESLSEVLMSTMSLFVVLFLV